MDTGDLGVVVGYEDSPSAREALRWGAAEAGGRGLPLTVCHAWDWPYHEWPGELVPLELVRRPARRLVGAAVAWVGRHHPDVRVITLTDRGSPSVLLAEVSADAAMIVLGTRGYGEVRGLAAGSVTGHVTARARCPVIVMRGSAERGSPERDPGEVLVGFDGSPSSRAALAFGAERARRLGVPVRALIARREWDRGADTQELRVQVRGLAWDELDHWLRACPELRAEVEAVDEPVRRALLRAARTAGLLVVGTRGLGELRGLLHGSVSQAMVHHAPCPVAVVPEPYGGGRTVTLAPLATGAG
ncbi:universal stress protein [Nonomuraea sp. FMUSA5-5]|uniref:Universal stress protein n=1 Tax=Nonomuraea composti TaxID=2720023 RepID=A0ABX1AX22_9ACTN|nr:universal stress protein [Nonomuraea sp. FMUSA5-5]NJP88717.1 universal stress protein [Nonomuraea sp. FMUSA5-5]